MDLRGVIHLLGWLLLFLAGAMLIPLPFALSNDSSDHTALLAAREALDTLKFGSAAYNARISAQQLATAKEKFEKAAAVRDQLFRIRKQVFGITGAEPSLEPSSA